MYELYHHGILGQKWGIRRYQNEDGSLTPAGRKRYLLNPEDKRIYEGLKPKYKKLLSERTQVIDDWKLEKEKEIEETYENHVKNLALSYVKTLMSDEKYKYEHLRSLKEEYSHYGKLKEIDEQILKRKVDDVYWNDPHKTENVLIGKNFIEELEKDLPEEIEQEIANEVLNKYK